MRLSTHKQKPSPNSKLARPVKTAKPNRALLGQSREVFSVLHSKGVIENSSHRKINTQSQERDTRSIGTAFSHLSHAAKLSPQNSPAADTLLQTKLIVSEPGDQFEQEADRMANQVIGMPEPRLQSNGESGLSTQPLQRTKTIQAKHDQASNQVQKSVSPLAGKVLRSSGQPLDTQTRAFMEPRFGKSFDHVRVHSDARAAESARRYRALAYTAGRDVVFGKGQYQPSTKEGKKLLAHELAHVIQQGNRGLRLSRKGYEGHGDNLSAAPWFDGVKATIDHIDPPVNTTRSVAWAGIDNGGTGGMKWLQGGWGKSQGEAAKIYWEYTDKTGTWAKGFSSAPAASETFEIRKEGTEAVWRHGGTAYKRVNWNQFDTIEFRRAVYTTEMHSPPGDHTPGRVSNKNDFANCAAKRAGGSYTSAGLSTTFDSASNGNVQRQSGSNFRTWDSRDA